MFDVRDHPDLIETEHGLPHLDVDRAYELVEESKIASWDEVTAGWLALLAEALPDEYRLKITHDTAVIAPTDKVDLETEHRSAQRRLEQIRALLQDPGSNNNAGDDGCMPDIMIIFGSTSLYYDYVSHDEPDGDSIASAGMHLRSRIPHIVINGTNAWSNSVTILHEMTHHALCDKTLPLWLEEGLCDYIPGYLLNENLFTMTRELKNRHLECWSEHGLQQFWSGESFGIPDDRSELSYHLSDVLLRLILSEQPKNLKPFIREASWEDAGESAAKKILGFGVGELAGRFLGEGPWAPDPDGWANATTEPES